MIHGILQDNQQRVSTPHFYEFGKYTLIKEKTKRLRTKETSEGLMFSGTHLPVSFSSQTLIPLKTSICPRDFQSDSTRVTPFLYSNRKRCPCMSSHQPHIFPNTNHMSYAEEYFTYKFLPDYSRTAYCVCFRRCVKAVRCKTAFSRVRRHALDKPRVCFFIILSL